MTMTVTTPVTIAEMSTLVKHEDGLPILGGVITRATSPAPYPSTPTLKAWLAVRHAFEATPQSYMSIVRGILNARSTAERRAEPSTRTSPSSKVTSSTSAMTMQCKNAQRPSTRASERDTFLQTRQSYVAKSDDL
ncbi:hypothetical protein M422DRAFT_250273 [Sphaerobolus stellatus SS14]|uniref:Uncharacterized protein n=1 Tax=Sphaerobolus stellatus (strain SS14) TaxID=990650 RepID=A0A0C9W4D6_SPHS4|nr:hypothetical protein M422DRAFT_250273 [Sphaerobolus stellatus SS14]